MAGHSKWKNIQHRKGAQDAKRGKVFTKIAKEITVATKMGGEDPDANPRLRLALTKARSANMPRDNVDRAVKKGTGEGDTVEYLEKTYEGYGPGGTAFIVECLTDNINRTVSDVRHAFTRSGGNLGTDGSVAYMFQAKGVLSYEAAKISDYDKMFEVALENGADDVEEDDDSYQVTCEPGVFNDLKQALDDAGFEPGFAEVSKIPENMNPLDSGKAESVMKLVDILEDNDDVQNVYHNAELPDG